jgi:hypothetical protein
MHLRLFRPPDETDPLTPLARRLRDNITGTPVQVGENVWLFADTIAWPYSDRWDALKEGWSLPDVRFCALELLEANYRLTPDESIGLIRTVPDGFLQNALRAALWHMSALQEQEVSATLRRLLPSCLQDSAG